MLGEMEAKRIEKYYKEIVARFIKNIILYKEKRQ
jgi:hypothetical protein